MAQPRMAWLYGLGGRSHAWRGSTGWGGQPRVAWLYGVEVQPRMAWLYGAGQRGAVHAGLASLLRRCSVRLAW